MEQHGNDRDDGFFLSTGDKVTFTVNEREVATYEHEGGAGFVPMSYMCDKMVADKDDNRIFLAATAGTWDSKRECDRYSRVRGKLLPSPCMVVAMRKLLNDLSWCPRWIEQHIRLNNGFSLDVLKVLELFAPVRAVEPHQDYNIPDGEKVIAMFFLDGTGHAECMEWRYARQLKTLMALVVRKETADELQRPAETQRPDAHVHERQISYQASFCVAGTRK